MPSCSSCSTLASHCAASSKLPASAEAAASVSQLSLLFQSAISLFDKLEAEPNPVARFVGHWLGSDERALLVSVFDGGVR